MLSIQLSVHVNWSSNVLRVAGVGRVSMCVCVCVCVCACARARVCSCIETADSATISNVRDGHS